MAGGCRKRLNEQIKRNRDRFFDDFMFQITAEEAERSRSQIATLKSGRGQNIKYRPYAFTEHGAIQAANVLSSPRAIAMGVYVLFWLRKAATRPMIIRKSYRHFWKQK
jgi:hypothetical protein